MGQRITKEVLFLRHEFSKDERLEMGAKLAEAYNRMSEIEEEEASMKAQVKEKKSQAEATIGSLSRNLGAGFTMVNVDCEPLWDVPNVGEVTLKRKDTGEVAKVRVMTEAERQMELPLAGDVVVVAAEKSAENIIEFFNGKVEPKEAAADEFAEEPVEDLETDEQEQAELEPDVFSDPDPAASKDAIKAENDAAFEGEAPRKRGRPRGFSKPSNASAISDF